MQQKRIVRPSRVRVAERNYTLIVMAKTKAQSRSSGKQKKQQVEMTAEQLYNLAHEALETSQPDVALSYAQDLLDLVNPGLSTSSSMIEATPLPPALPALTLLGEISVELGDILRAQVYFQLAIKLDPEGHVPDELGGGAEKFLWLAQLSDEGGADSVKWFEKGVASLKFHIDLLEKTTMDAESKEAMVDEKGSQIANALCSVVEVYMTDLSWEADAETRCDNLITEALLFAPENPEVLQTLASVRLSQLKHEDARSALSRSMALWKDADPQDDIVPDYPTRISLARLLMEAEMEDEAMVVLERLALEDDQSVEACYLGGWCLHLLAEKRKKAQEAGATANGDEEDPIETSKASRKWLLNTRKLYNIQDYEDSRLGKHTEELIEELDKILGPPPSDGEADEEYDEWEDEEFSEDEEMAGME